jgi:predicted ATPase
MKTIKETTTKAGKRRITVELDHDEKIVAVREDCHYELGYPLEDIVQSHIIADAKSVTWCPLEQRWVK